MGLVVVLGRSTETVCWHLLTQSSFFFQQKTLQWIRWLHDKCTYHELSCRYLLCILLCARHYLCHFYHRYGVWKPSSCWTLFVATRTRSVHWSLKETCCSVDRWRKLRYGAVWSICVVKLILGYKCSFCLLSMTFELFCTLSRSISRNYWVNMVWYM